MRTVCSSSAGESPALGFLLRRGNTTTLVLYAFSRLAFSCGLGRHEQGQQAEHDTLSGAGDAVSQVLLSKRWSNCRVLIWRSCQQRFCLFQVQPAMLLPLHRACIQRRRRTVFWFFYF